MHHIFIIQYLSWKMFTQSTVIISVQNIFHFNLKCEYLTQNTTTQKKNKQTKKYTYHWLYNQNRIKQIQKMELSNIALHLKQKHYVKLQTKINVA